MIAHCPFRYVSFQDEKSTKDYGENFETEKAGTGNLWIKSLLKNSWDAY